MLITCIVLGYHPCKVPCPIKNFLNLSLLPLKASGFFKLISLEPLEVVTGTEVDILTDG
jgi:hypothetical protein